MQRPKQHSESSFDDKWPPAVAAKGYTQIPNCLIFCQNKLGIDNGEFKTLAFLVARKFGTANPWPSVQGIAESSGSAQITVRKHLRSLEAKGLIKRIYHVGFNSEYDLTPLIHKLTNHDCINPIKKRVGVSSKINRPPYSKRNTKEDELKRRNNKNTGLNSIGEIMAQRTRPP